MDWCVCIDDPPPLLICHVHKLFVIKTDRCDADYGGGDTNTVGVYNLGVSKETSVTSDIQFDRAHTHGCLVS